MADIQVTQGYNGATVTAGVGDTLSIELPENPTTGYRWSCINASETTKTILFAGDTFQPGNQSGVGGGGLRILRFAAQSKGSAAVRCTLARPWEAETPRDRFTLEVSVR